MQAPVSRLEKIAGYFVLLALVPLLLLVLAPGLRPGGFLNRRQFPLHIVADDGIDLSAGDQVTMKGIQIGEVEGLELLENHRVLINCSIYPRYGERVTEDARVYLVPPAVVGSAKIDIRPGTGPPCRRGSTIMGRERVRVVPSLQDQANELLVQTGVVITNANRRIEELENTLVSFQQILEQVQAGRGSLGRLVQEEAFYERISELVGRLETVAETAEALRRPLEESLPELAGNLLTASRRLDAVLVDFQNGMRHFPAAADRAAASLHEGRRILESLKRNVLIRRNLPRDPEPEGMAPPGLRSSVVPMPE